MINAQIPRPPYIKGKGFLDKLMPIVKKGIPKEADSLRDKRVVGTAAWQSFWEEEIYKIHNGVVCPGVGWVPGRFYYYMNYKMMSTIKGVITPDMVDLHLELAHLIEYAKKNGHNILCPKGRRKGISEAAHTMVVDYGWRFSLSYQAGVAAGNKTYVDDFLAKWKFANSHIVPELKIKTLLANDDEIIAGYTIKDEHGAWVDNGTKNTIFARTMHTNPNMFKGLYLNDVISEELGEHENWFEFFTATRDCLMSGDVQAGMFMGFGTGGNINRGSKDFKRISEEAAKFNFIEFLIPATRFYFYGGASLPERQLPPESELLKKYKLYELIGVEDTDLAEKAIMKKRDELLKSGNLKEYNEFLQNNPLNKSEIFKKTVVNNFDVNKLNEQLYRIDSSEYKKHSRYKLEWIKDDKGMIKIPLQVKCLPAKELDDDSDCVLIIDSEHPRKSFKNLYVAGIDSYDQDTSKTSKSLGAMCVMIRENMMSSAMKKVPVAVIRTRPKRKERFYEMCLQLAVYYNLVGNVLVDVRNPGIIQYFKERGAERYLAGRPARFESPNSEQGHDFGVSLNSYSKPMMVSIMQTNIVDYCHDIWFRDLIDELGNYDEVEIGSDNDLADAYGIALMQDISADLKPKDMTDDVGDKRYDLPFLSMDGTTHEDIPKLSTDEEDHLLFGRL